MKTAKEQARLEGVISALFKAMKPEWKWIAQDKDGSWYAYTAKPHVNNKEEMWELDFKDDEIDTCDIDSNLFDLPSDDNPNFAETLIEMKYKDPDTGAMVIVWGGEES